MTLEQYLSENSIRPSTFAARIGVAPSTITRLIKGERSPRLDLIRLISEGTEGLVTAEDFMAARPASLQGENVASAAGCPVPSSASAEHEAAR